MKDLNILPKRNCIEGSGLGMQVGWRKSCTTLYRPNNASDSYSTLRYYMVQDVFHSRQDFVCFVLGIVQADAKKSGRGGKLWLSNSFPSSLIVSGVYHL